MNILLAHLALINHFNYSNETAFNKIHRSLNIFNVKIHLHCQVYLIEMNSSDKFMAAF